MHLTMLLWFSAIVFMAVVVSPVWSDSGIFGLPDGLYLGIGALIVGVLTFFGLRRKSNSATDIAQRLKDILLTKEAVDRAVENVLGKLGVPALLADKIGDIVAMVLLGLPEWVANQAKETSLVSQASLAVSPSNVSQDETVIQLIRGEIVRQAADAHPAQLAELLPGFPPEAYTVRDNRVLCAERVVVDPRVTAVIQAKVGKFVVAKATQLRRVRSV